jgi:hypothetical protein
MRFKISLSVDLAPTKKGEVITMSDWASDRLRRIQHQQDSKRIMQEAFVESQKLKKAEGFPLWLQLRAMVESHCKDFNAKARQELLTFEVQPDSELSVRATIEGKHGRLAASFEESRGSLSWQCGQNSGKWKIITNGAGGVCFQGLRDGCAELEDMAAEMLDALVLEPRWP